MDDRNAIRLLKQGDISGLEWLVDQYDAEATRIACLITGNLQQAEDVVQESFLHAYDRINTFDEERPFRPWFCVPFQIELSEKPKKTPAGFQWMEMD